MAGHPGARRCANRRDPCALCAFDGTARASAGLEEPMAGHPGAREIRATGAPPGQPRLDWTEPGRPQFAHMPELCYDT